MYLLKIFMDLRLVKNIRMIGFMSGIKMCHREYENDQDDEERCELFDDATQELLVCTVRRFKMIKYSFGQDEEYVAVKEDEYEDLTSTSKDACRAYQEIFRKIEEGKMVTRVE
nr:hypothetical protein [Tanacetum cinerariifolium]